MTNKITIDLNLTGEQSTARGLDNVGDKVEDLGDDLKKAAVDAGFLDRRLVELRGSTKALAAEFAQTGDKDIFKQLQGSRRELRQLEKVKKEFFSIGDEVGDEVRKGFAKSFVEFGSDLKGAMAGIKGPAIGGAVLLGAALTPFLGAAVSSAVLGGVGAGGIIGGIALAARDARVQDEAASLGKHLSTAFTTAAEPFIAPTIEALHVLDGAVDGVAGQMREAFATVAPVLVPLTRGIAGLVEEMMPGLIKGLEAAKPVLRVIANELPDLGAALGDFFEDLAEDPDGAIMAMKALFQITTFTIRALGEMLGWLERTFETTQRWGLAAADAAEKVLKFLGLINPAFALLAKLAGVAGDNYRDQIHALILGKDASGDFAKGVGEIADSATLAKRKMQELNNALLDFLGIVQRSEKANINYERTWDEMIDTLSQSKRTLDITTEAGRRNREAIEAHADAIAERHRQRMEEGMTLEQSLPIMDAEIERLRKQLLAMGYNKQAADELINIYAKWPTKAVTVIEAQGLEATKEGIQELISLFQLANRITIGGIGGAKVGGQRAAGGPVLPGQTYLVGENGPEILTMGSSSGQVYSNAQSTAMAAAAMPSVSLNLTAQPTGRALEDVLMESLAYKLRVTGGVIGQFRVPRLA